MQRRRRINPIDDAKYYVQSGRDKGGLDIQYINACKGRGLFTSTSFTKGDFVCEYRGELISQQECKRRQRLYHEHLKVFMFEFKYNGKLWCIDASKEDGSYGRLVNDNHINPNTKIKYITVQGKPHLCLFANQDINPREEITYNYGDSEWPWRSNTITTSNRIETPAIELNESSPAVGPVASVGKSVDEEMPQKVSGDSNPPPTVKDFEETITTSNRIETPAIELNENSPAAGPVASVRKMGQSCSKRPPSEEPSNSDTCVTIQKCRHRLVCTSVSSLDKCIHCVGPVSSFKWLGYKCTVCSGVWHKSCLRRAENRSLEDLLHEQHLSKSSGSSSEDELQDPQSEHNSITHDDQCSTDEEYIPDSESEDDFNSDASVPRIPSLSKTGLTQTKAPIPNADVKLATEPGMSKTELWPPLDEHIVPSAAETADSATSIQQTKDGAHILTSKPVTTSNINYCYVCGKAQTKIARHLRTHKTHTEIEHIFSLPKKSKERKTLLEKLRNRGNFKHNNAVLQSGRGSLKIKRKTKSDRPAETFIHCMYCKGLYVRKELWRHARRCPDKPDDNGADNESGKRRVLGLAAAVDSVSFQKISSGVWKLISNMKDDDVASVVRNDVCILQFAQSLFNRHGQDPTKYEYMRQKLREVGRLLLCLRNDFSVHNMEDAIKPGNFQKVVQGVKKVSGYNEEQHSYQTPSLALKLGHTLKKISEIVHCRALVAEDENLAKSTETFNKLYKSKWSELVSHSALNTLSDAKYNKPSTLPFTEDVQILHQYLGKTAESAFCNLKEKATTQNYSDLAKVTLAQVVVFNRRRAGEVSKMRIGSFIERDQTKLHEDVAMGLSKTEQKLCKYFTRLEIMGKRGRKVAVLLTPSMVDALSLLTSKRSECGVCDKNIFLFARPKSMSHYRGQDCLRVHASQCGAKHPEHLRSTQLRKHVATLSQVLNLKNNELDQVADFMGHDLHVHREFYRLPVPTTQLAKISKLLLSMEKGQLSSMQGKSLDEIEIEVEMSLSEAENSTSESEFDDGSTGAATLSGCGPTRPVDSASDSTIRDQDDKTRGVAEPSVSSTVNETVSAPEEDDVAPHNPKRTAKRAWSNAEITAIMRYFKGHIAKGKLATKNECAQCKLAEGSVLEQRTVQNIRDFVRNRGISAKRQSQKYKP